MSNQIAEAEIKCPTCSSSLALSPEDVVISCRYCGEAFTAGRSKIQEHHYFPDTVSLKDAETKIYNYLKDKLKFRGWKSYQGVELDKILIPYWLVKYKANSHYRGYKRSTRTEKEYYTDSEGNRKSRNKSVTVYEPVDRRIDDDGFEPLLCRNGIRIFGLNKLNSTILSSIGKEGFKEFKSEDLLDKPEDITFLSGEILSFEAKELVETKIQDRHRATARSNTTELFDCRTQVNVQGMSYLHYPVVSGEYSYGKHTYRVLMDAHSGEIIDIEYPVTFRLRAINMAITFGVLIGGLVLGFMSPSISFEEGGDGIFYLIPLILGGVIAFFTNRIAWATQTR